MKNQVGIKNNAFNIASGNGKSHRASAARKRVQHLRNRKARADLYREFQGEKGWMFSSPDCREWHQRLDGLSAGSAE